MVEMMLGEALAVETARKRDMHEVTLAAIGSAFAKSEQSGGYLKSLRAVLGEVEDERQRARGMEPKESKKQMDESIKKLRNDLRGGGKRRKK